MPRWHDYVDRILATLGRWREIEWIPIAALLCAGLAGWAFAELADHVLEGESDRFDRAVLMALREPNDPSDPLGPRWVEDFMRDATSLGSAGVLGMVTLATCGYLWLHGKHHAAWYVLSAVVGALLLSVGLKLLFDRPRPDLVPHGDHVYSSAFPSGHSLLAAATYLTLGVLLARYEDKRHVRIYLAAVAAALTLLVGASRVYLGVHWPTDVAAGWSLGAAWALVCWVVAGYLQRRGVIEAKPIDRPGADAAS